MRVLDTRRVCIATAALAVVAFSGPHPVDAEAQGRTTRTGEPPTITAGRSQANWASHNLDPYNQRYATLDQINATTVGRLQRRWSFDVPAGLSVGQVTPLVVDGLMYVHSGATVLAINAVTGDEVWRLEVDGVSGRYFAKSKAIASSEASYDEESARRLWEASEQLVASTA